MHYIQDAVEKSWDIAQVHDSVAVLLYHREKDAFVLVKQFRPPVYLKNSNGFTFELCAGIVDKSKSLVEIAREEIHEECGYDVRVEKIGKITSFYTSVGFAGARQTLYYAELDDSMKAHEGGGVDVEAIEVVYLDRHDAKTFLFDESRAKTPGLMFAFMWFFDQKQQMENGNDSPGKTGRE
jgi:UDP-sugar diphosphatase